MESGTTAQAPVDNVPIKPVVNGISAHNHGRTEIYTISTPSMQCTSQSSTDSRGTCSKWPKLGLEDRTFRVGRLLGSYPLLSILIAVSVVTTGSMGFLNFHVESRQEELWIDHESPAYIAKTTARTFPTGNRIRLSIVINALDVFQSDIIQLMLQIDAVVRNFTFRGKGWEKLCFRKNSECQKFSLLNIIEKDVKYDYMTPQIILSAVNEPNKRRLGVVPPYFIAPDDIISGVTTNTSSYVTAARVTRLVYFLQRQEPERITSSKPIKPEEVLQHKLSDMFEVGFENVSISVSLTYADGDREHNWPWIPVDYFTSLLYACIAFLIAIFISTGKYTAARHGFWLAISALLGLVLAIAFGFGIASAVGMAFTPMHFILPVLLLSMSVFGFLAMELELRTVADARPNMLCNEKLGMALQRSFATLVLCMLSNFLVFAIGIGSKLPVVRSFCVFGVTSSVGIFISQILFLFGCLSAWQRTYESTGNAWFCCIRRNHKMDKDQVSLYSILKPVFGFLASNLSDNIGRGFVLIAVAVLTGVCIYFLFSLRVIFQLSRFDGAHSDLTIQPPELRSLFRLADDSIGCVYLGNLPYYRKQAELRTFHSYLKDHVAIRPRSISSWFEQFQIWTANQQRMQTIRSDSEPAGSINFDKSAFYKELTKFLFESNFVEDVSLLQKANEEVEIQASRICFRFKVGFLPENYSSAIENIASVANDLQLGSAVVDSNMMMEVMVQKSFSNELWILFGAYFVVLLIISGLMLQSVVSALIVFISFALITIQSIGLVASQNIPMDSLLLICLFCFGSVVIQMIFYEATAFARLSGKAKRKIRLKSTMISSAPPALACGICAIAIFVPFFNSSLEVFRLILKMCFTTIAIGFVHVFLFLPVALSTATPEAFTTATLRLRQRLKRRGSENPSPSLHFDGGTSQPVPVELPNDQVHFVARNPLERTGSISSLRLHLKSVGLRAVLESLPSPEIPSPVPEEEPVINTNPNGGHDDPDSLDRVELSDALPDTSTAPRSSDHDRSFRSTAKN